MTLSLGSDMLKPLSHILTALVIMSTLLIAFIITLSITQNDGARILAVFPTPSISHQVVFRPFTRELARRGHEVVVITTDPAFEKGKAPPNLTEIDVHDISYGKWQELYKLTSKGDGDLINQMKLAFNMLIDIVEMQLKIPEIQRLIKHEKFDLLFLEACIRPALVLSHVFKTPVIQIASFGFVNFNVDTIGASWHPLLYPDNLSQKLYNLTKWEKVVAMWNYYRLENVLNTAEEAENAMSKRLFGPDFPTIGELKDNVQMMFLYVHPIWESNRPVPPSVIYIWGIDEKPVKDLPTDLKKYLDSSKKGVIYMSLGTNVKPSLLPPEKLKILVKVFSQLEYDVLWKWDKDELPGRSKNIRISKWLPQSDLLRHPKIKLFITQGGLQSTSEAITAGVPLIGIPMLGDQWYNVEKYVYHKIGVKLDMATLQEEEFANAIKSVIADESYRRNIARLRDLMKDQPLKPLERAVWWTEYVLRHRGASHLRSPTANITWTQYLELELVFTILFIVITAVAGTLIILFNIYQCCRRRTNQKKRKQK